MLGILEHGEDWQPCFVSAAFKVIKGWLPPAAVKKIKFLTKTNMTDYVAEDNMLEDWGGSDTWQYVWQPEESGAGGGGAEGKDRN